MLRSVVVASVLTSSLAVSLIACGADEDEVVADPTPSATPADAELPDSVSATDPGTSLSYGDSATLVWQPTADLTGVLDLTVESVEEQRKSVLEGWLRDDSMKESRPYFVTVSLTNAGEDDLAGQAVPLYLRDDQARLGAPWTLGGDFTTCQSGPLPSTFEPGATEKMCLVYLAPDGAHIEDLVFEPTEGYDPITWTGDVGAPPKVRSRDKR